MTRSRKITIVLAGLMVILTAALGLQEVRHCRTVDALIVAFEATTRDIVEEHEELEAKLIRMLKPKEAMGFIAMAR